MKHRTANNIFLRTRELKLEFDHDIFHTKHLLQQNQSINEGARAITIFFLKIATVTVTLALDPQTQNSSRYCHTSHLWEVKSKSIHE